MIACSARDTFRDGYELYNKSILDFIKEINSRVTMPTENDRGELKVTTQYHYLTSAIACAE